MMVLEKVTSSEHMVLFSIHSSNFGVMCIYASNGFFCCCRFFRNHKYWSEKKPGTFENPWKKGGGWRFCLFFCLFISASDFKNFFGAAPPGIPPAILVGEFGIPWEFPMKIPLKFRKTHVVTRTPNENERLVHLQSTNHRKVKIEIRKKISKACSPS